MVGEGNESCIKAAAIRNVTDGVDQTEENVLLVVSLCLRLLFSLADVD